MISLKFCLYGALSAVLISMVHAQGPATPPELAKVIRVEAPAGWRWIEASANGQGNGGTKTYKCFKDRQMILFQLKPFSHAGTALQQFAKSAHQDFEKKAKADGGSVKPSALVQTTKPFPNTWTFEVVPSADAKQKMYTKFYTFSCPRTVSVSCMADSAEGYKAAIGIVEGIGAPK